MTVKQKGWSFSVKLWLYTTLLIFGVMGALTSVISWRFSDFYYQQKLDSLSQETANIASQLDALPTWSERYSRLQSGQLAAGSQLVLLSARGEVLLSAGQLTGINNLQSEEWLFQGNNSSGLEDSNDTSIISGSMIGGWSGWVRGPRVTDFFDSDNFAQVLGGKALSIKAVPKNKLSGSPAMLISACPIGSPAEGIVLLGTSTSSVQESINAFNRIITYASFAAVFLGIIVSLIFARQVTRPLAIMHKGALRMAKGDFQPIKGVTSKDEFGDLAEALNQTGESLRNHMDWLSQEKNLLQGIIESISDAVIMLGTDGSLVYANDPAKMLWTEGETVIETRKNEILNFLRTQMTATKLPDEKPIRGDSETDGGEIYDERDTQESGDSSEAGENTNQKTDESSQSMPIMTTLVLGSQILAVALEPMTRTESVPGSVAVLRDVTASLRAEKERRDLLASVTHELRTPLHLIQGYLEAIQDGVIPANQFDEHISLVLEETGRLTRLVQGLQDLNKLEKGKGLEFEEIQIEDFMADVEHRFQRRAQEMEIALEVEHKSGLLWADRDKLLQIFINLLDNAFRHTPARKGVKVLITEDGDEYTFAVQDEGEGIPEESLGQVFDRFYRVDKARSRKDGGMGLGLAIVKQIAEAHGGSVRVTSTLGAGTTFWVRLPKYKEEGVPAE